MSGYDPKQQWGYNKKNPCLSLENPQGIYINVSTLVYEMEPDNSNHQVQTIMATISSFMASRRIEDKLRAASLLDHHYTMLPSHYRDRILEELKKDSHYEIKEALSLLIKHEKTLLASEPEENEIIPKSPDMNMF